MQRAWYDTRCHARTHRTGIRTSPRRCCVFFVAAHVDPPPRAPVNGRPGFPFWFSGRWRALAKGTAWAGSLCNSSSFRCGSRLVSAAPLARQLAYAPSSAGWWPFVKQRKRALAGVKLEAVVCALLRTEEASGKRTKMPYKAAAPKGTAFCFLNYSKLPLLVAWRWERARPLISPCKAFGAG